MSPTARAHEHVLDVRVLGDVGIGDLGYRGVVAEFTTVCTVAVTTGTVRETADVRARSRHGQPAVMR
jgi:hypothetical protein